MSISTFMGIETTLRGLLAQQRALDVTGHNIANASTEGYSRQTAEMTTTAPLQAAPNQLLGTGVDVTQYLRVRDTFVDTQLRAQTMLQGAASTKEDGLSQVELVLGEPSDSGLNTLLGKFWSSWQDLANAPENAATRQAVVQTAGALADGIRSLSSQLKTISQQTAQNATSTLAEVNSIAKDVVSLNGAIASAVAVGDAPNDLRDQRDLALDRLSALGAVSSTEYANGTTKVMFDGVTLLDGTTQLTVSESVPGTLTNDASTPETATLTATLGKLGALADLRDVTLPGYLSSLNTLASTLITQVNALHGGGADVNTVVQTTGFGLDGSSGKAFFGGTNAANITVVVSPDQIAAASVANAPGDASNATRIADLSTDTTLGPLAGASISGAYAQLVTATGSDSKDAQRASTNATTLVDALTNRRQSISGVSLDEEMTNLVRFQRAYSASARAMNVMSDVLDLLITRTGRVGI
ncbi:MAG: flagellar hook-associated protein FlgK [Gaiellaceae bacterium]